MTVICHDREELFGFIGVIKLGAERLLLTITSLKVLGIRTPKVINRAAV
jgi:hypothetical protein